MKRFAKFGGMVGSVALGLALTTSAIVPSAGANTHVSLTRAPSAHAPMSVWRAWAAQERAFVHAEDLAAAFPASATCAMTSATITPYRSLGNIRVPRGILLDFVTYGYHCSSSGAGLITQPGGSAQVSVYCGIMTSCKAGAVTDGYDAVGTWTAQGTKFIGSGYTYTGSASTYGHVEMGQPATSGTCDIGTKLGNGGEMTLYNMDGALLEYGPQSADIYFSATWWQDNGGGNYTNFGTLCGTY